MNEAMQALAKNPGMVGRGILFLFLCGMCFMTFFASIALYFFSANEQNFLARAVQTQAQVINVKQERFLESYSTTNSSDTNRQNVKYISIISLSFQDAAGNTVTTKTQDGEMSLLEAGDTVQLLYDPENPEKVILARNKDNASMMRTISYIMACATMFLFFVAFMMTRLEKRRSQSL